MRHRQLRACGALFAVILLGAACAGGEEPPAATVPAPEREAPEPPQAGQVPEDDPDVARREAPSGFPPRGPSPAELAGFHGQELQWEGCGDLECADLEVPLDYGDLDGATLSLEVQRHLADGEPAGVLAVFSGDWDAAETFETRVERLLAPAALDRFDVIRLDRRGVDASARLGCLEEVDPTRLLDLAGPSAGADGRQTEVGRLRAACREGDGALLDHIDALSAARDLDVLRAALGEPQISLYARGSGGYRAALYVNLFPEQVRHAVFDGGLNPALSGHEVPLEQAAAYEAALARHVADCQGTGECPLAGDAQEGVEQLRAFLERLHDSPLPALERTELSAGTATAALVAALHDPRPREELTSALAPALQEEDGSALLTASRAWFAGPSEDAERAPGRALLGAWSTSCLDRPVTEPEAWTELPEELHRSSSTFGAWLTAREALCEALTADAEEPAPRWMEASGTGPLLVLQATEDPLNPQPWSERLAAHLLTAVWIVHEAEGHGAYGQDLCVTEAVDRYLLEDVAPPLGTRC